MKIALDQTATPYLLGFNVSPFIIPQVHFGAAGHAVQVVSDHPSLRPFHPIKWANLNIMTPLLAKHITWTADRVGPCGSSRHQTCRPWFVRILQLAESLIIITGGVGSLDSHSPCLFFANGFMLTHHAENNNQHDCV
jgi:hypothetical protein